MEMIRPAGPLISVIVPARNVADFIHESVDSVLHQTTKDLEIIVVDGGSTDGTVERLDDIQDARLRIVRQKGSGLAEARNLGVAEGASRYVAFLDGDDAWHPTFIERHLEVMESRPEIDAAFSLSIMIDETGRAVGQTSSRASGLVSFEELLVENPVANGSSLVLRREVFQRARLFDTGLSAFEDLEMWLRAALLRPDNIWCINETLTRYRRRKGQLSGDWRRLEPAWEHFIEKVCSYAPEYVQRVEEEARRKQRHYRAWLAYESGCHLEALRLQHSGVRKSLLLEAVEPQNWLLAGACVSGMLLPSAVHRSLVQLITGFLRWFAERARKFRRHASVPAAGNRVL
jgi:glycosyltransferase involved in cell wall biosynthesis